MPGNIPPISHSGPLTKPGHKPTFSPLTALSSLRLAFPRREIPPATPVAAIAPDCRHYRGDKPCLHNRLCQGCGHYDPFAHRLCIIKLGALGDVIRTLCILPELRRRYAEAHITWVSLPSGCRMIQGHPLIDRVLGFDALTAMMLSQESFDTVICLDKEPAPCALAMSLFAKRKLGVGLSPQGTPVPLNPEAEGYFHLGLSDELKFRVNERGYPQLACEALGLTWRGERYTLPANAALRDRARLQLAGRGWRPGVLTLGVNVGAGDVFANKMWPVSRIVDVLRLVLERDASLQVLLLGGPRERGIVDGILGEMSQCLGGDLSRGTPSRGAAGLSGGGTDAVSRGKVERVIDAGCEHEEAMFAAVVDACDVLFTGDTMAMHVGVALGKQVVAFLGPTCEQEIDLFGRGEKLVAKVACGPCYKRQCDRRDACIEAIAPAEAVEAIFRSVAICRTGLTDVQTQRGAVGMCGVDPTGGLTPAAKQSLTPAAKREFSLPVRRAG